MVLNSTYLYVLPSENDGKKEETAIGTMKKREEKKKNEKYRVFSAYTVYLFSNHTHTSLNVWYIPKHK